MKAVLLHAGVVGLLFLLQFVLPDYHHANLARIMVYAILAIGYNLLFGYTGLLSLGHAMFFAAGAYGAGIAVYWFGLGPAAAFLVGLLSGAAASAIAGIVLVRVTGVAFLIVTLMLAQAAYLSTLYFNTVTLGDQGIVLTRMAPLELPGLSLSLGNASVKYNIALIGFAISLFIAMWLVRSPIGRVFVAIRENEPRTRMLGYDTARYRYLAIVVSGSIAGLAGSLYCLLFAYVGASFAALQFSTLPLLWTLLGGAGTILGPFVGTGLMFYLIDISSGYTSSYLIVVGVVLLAITLWFPRGLMGALSKRLGAWLP
ncbi:MAG: branched-chain amino acid ABC transporter permease [Alphaproteobacteria bacterium]|nr:branched-chain amino acid ABC transporter permease [Alphaproteobacteria bacterium]